MAPSTVLYPGKELQMTYQVKPEDAASFQGVTVHRVCSTFALAREVEWATRQFALMVLGQGQEGIGTALQVDHKSPAFIGEEMNIVAKVDSFDGKRLHCSFSVLVGSRLVATGSTGQAIVNKLDLAERFARLKQH